MRSFVLLVLTVSTLTACRHPIFIIGEGDVTSASGDRDCLLEDFQAEAPGCTENTVKGSYSEAYSAVPRPGWQFAAWGIYCARSEVI